MASISIPTSWRGEGKGCVGSGQVITSFVICSSHIRGARNDIAFSFREMPAGKNLKQLEAQHCRKPRHVSSARLPTPGQPSEWVLLRRIYFLNSERSKYLGLGLYSDRGCRAFFELGCARQMPVLLLLSLVPKLILHLPKLCEHLTSGECYKYNEMTFSMQGVR